MQHSIGETKIGPATPARPQRPSNQPHHHPHHLPNKLVMTARLNELIWRKTRITINFNIYYDSCMAVKKAISIRKAELMEQKVINCEGDQKKLFSLIHSLFGSKKITVLPEYTSSFTLASSINMFFIVETLKLMDRQS